MIFSYIRAVGQLDLLVLAQAWQERASLRVVELGATQCGFGDRWCVDLLGTEVPLDSVGVFDLPRAGVHRGLLRGQLLLLFGQFAAY